MSFRSRACIKEYSVLETKPFIHQQRHRMILVKVPYQYPYCFVSLNCGSVGHAVIGLQRVMVHIISKELLRNRKGLKAANHCLRSLLESMVDLKELIESSETDGSDTTSSRSDSASGDEDDDNSSDVRTISLQIRAQCC